jgi:putative ABC transport system permease protein
MLSDLWMRMRAVLRRKAVEGELDDELRFDFEQRVEKYVRAGMTREEAMRRARLEFGTPDSVKEECREARGVHFLETFVQDVRYGLRMLRKSPGFTTVAVLTLALGIGANTAIFSVVEAFLLRPLPVNRPAQLVRVFGSVPGKYDFQGLSYPDYLDLRKQASTFAGVLAYGRTSVSLSGVDGRREAQAVRAEIVTANYFSLLGVQPILGRGFGPQEERGPGSAPVTVISYGMWNSRFHSDPGVLGKGVRLNGYPFTIVGVAPRNFYGAELSEAAEVWVPMMMQAIIRPPSAGFLRESLGTDLLSHRDAGWLHAIARLRPGATRSAAAAECNGIAGRIRKMYSSKDSDWTFQIVPVRGALDASDRDDAAPVAGLLMAVVGLVLLICCANVAGLLLVKAAGRQKEVGMRMALGASASRLVQQFLVENFLLASAGGFTGWLFAYWLTSSVPGLLPPALFQLPVGLTPDARALAFTAATSIGAGLFFGLLPALKAARVPVARAVREEGMAAGIGRHRLQRVLVVAQLALSTLLLVAAGLLVRSLLHAQSASLGFEPEHVATAWVDLDLRSYTRARGRTFYQDLLERLRSTPGVVSASLARTVPLGFAARAASVHIENRGGPTPGNRVVVGTNVIAPNYFRTMDTTILAGRDFTDEDTEGAPNVAIVNQTMAHHFWPGSAVGKHILYTKSQMAEIVGVVADSKYRAIGESTPDYVYVPLAQNFEYGMQVLVRTVGDPSVGVTAIRGAVASLDSDLPASRAQGLGQIVSMSLWPARAGAALLGAFGVLALVLAGIGTYGTVSYSVSQRSHEIGVRLALGALPGDIRRFVLGGGARLAGTGIIVGLVGAFAVTRVMQGLLYGVSASDPLTLVFVSAVLASAVLVACYVPARRAMQLDPMVALRHE